MMYGGPENYSQKIRQQVLIRDNFQSQLVTYTEARGWHRFGGYCLRPDNCSTLQVHHITPQRIGGANVFENMITLAECQHVGRCPLALILPRYASHRGKPGKWVSPDFFVVHRDMQESLMNYMPGNGFQKIFEVRDMLSQRGEVYWNTDYDEIFRQIAYQRTHDPQTWLRDIINPSQLVSE